MRSVAPLMLSSLPLFVHCSPFYKPHAPLNQAGPRHRRDNALPIDTLAPMLTTASTLMTAAVGTQTTTAVAVDQASSANLPTTTTAPDPSEILFLPPDAVATVLPASTPDETSESVVPLVMAYYPDWAASSFPPENIDFKRFDWIDFAFAVPDQNFNLGWDDPTGSPDLLHRLVNVAHTNGKKVKLSVGGWSGSRYFSSAVATDQSRRTFANNILAVYNNFNLDGIDIDWEYPSQQGEGNNQVSQSDTPNFLAFLQLLRLILPRSAKITAATQTSPFADANGEPIKDASQFAKVLDWILLMNYDVWSSSATPGPNAPLNNGCHNSTQPGANAVAAYNSWTHAGFPTHKLVLGVPSYGYISRSTATHLVQRSPLKRGLQVTNDDGGTDSGQTQFRNLVSQGALVRTTSKTSNGAPVYAGANGFTRHWDECSSTPFLRSDSAIQVITYDDPESLGMKASFAKKVGMLGVNMFDVHGDVDQWDLTDSVRRGLELIK